MAITTLEIAWAAGFLEGEGSFQNTNSPRVSAGQVQREPLERLQRIFGGRIYLAQPPANKPNFSPCHRWDLDVKRSIEVMMTLYVLMSPKRQAQIEFSLNKWKSAKKYIHDYAPHCKNGHLMTPDNFRYQRRADVKDPDAKGARICRTCERMKWHERKARGGIKPRKGAETTVIVLTGDASELDL